MNNQGNNIDAAEVAKFDRLAQDWWNPDGQLRTLHHINPTRLRYLNDNAAPAGRRVLDVGCGGGLLTEGMARQGARVTGLDASENAVRAARQHAAAGGLEIEYVADNLENYAASNEGSFDLVTCMELLEHVPDPQSLLRACARVLRRDGDLVLATINRNLKSYLGAVIGAEYLLRLLPRGTHDYAAFIRPSELAAWLRQARFKVLDIRGMRYLPGAGYCTLDNDPSVNYLCHARRVG